MGKYLDILKRAGLYDKNDINDKSPSAVSAAAPVTPFWSYKSFLSYYLRSSVEACYVKWGKLNRLGIARQCEAAIRARQPGEPGLPGC